MPLAKDMTNQQKQDFPVDAILNGGTSMKGGMSLQDQIANAPLAAFHIPTIKWAGYSTSMAQQAVYTAEALARLESTAGAIQNLVTALVRVSGGEPFDEAKLLAGIEATTKAAAEAGTAAAIASIETTVSIKKES